MTVPTIAPRPKLLDQVRKAIRTRHYSPKTEESYVHWIKRFIFFHNKRHPVEMSEKEIAQFLSSLASELHVSASTQNQALNAVLFLYRDVLRKEIGYVDGVVRAKRPHRLPVVLTRQEVKSILGILDHSDWLMVMLLYGAGLRLMECLQLRVKDIDFTSNQIVVRAGKGDKDRHTMLPAAVKEPLAKHLEVIKRATPARSRARLGPSRSAERPRSQISQCGKRVGMAMGISCNEPLHRSGNRRKTQTSPARIRVAESCETSRSQGRDIQAGNPSHVSPFFCDPFA